MKRTFSTLLLASLAFSQISASPMQDSKLDLSGSIFVDSEFPFNSSELSNNLHVSRARLDFKGQWSPTLSYKFRIERPSNGSNAEERTALMPLFVVTWKAYDNMQFNFGLDAPRYSQAGTAAQSYIQRDLGVLEDSIGKKIGTNVSGLIRDTYGYSFGVWSATARQSLANYSYSRIEIEENDGDIEFDPMNIDSVTETSQLNVTLSPHHSNRFAIGGRGNIVMLDHENYSWGVGAGLQSLDVIVPIVAEQTINNTTYYSTFEKRLALTADQSFALKRFSLNMAYHYFKYYRNNDPAVSSSKSSIPDGVYAFQRKNFASSGYVELTALVIGEGYRIDRSTGVVNRITPNAKYGALELALRFGREYYYNAAAAQFLKSSFNGTNGLPMTFTKESGYNLVTIDSISQSDIVVRAKGYTVAASYVANDHLGFKAEYYDIKTSVKSNTIWTTLEKEQGLRLRTEFTFS